MKHSIKSFQSRRGIVFLVSVVTVVAILGAGIYAAANVWPSLGARNVDTLRALIGDPAVARLETVMFQSADGIQQAKYRLGLNRPAAPWGVTPVNTAHSRLIRQGRLAILASFWVGFGAISFRRTGAMVNPLLNGMQRNRRYPLGYWRDYFYVTVDGRQPRALSQQ